MFRSYFQTVVREHKSGIKEYLNKRMSCVSAGEPRARPSVIHAH